MTLTLDDGNVILERDVGVVVRDGVRLSVDVYRPNRPGRFPAILEHIPYRKDDLRAIEDRSQNMFLVERRVRVCAAGRARHRQLWRGGAGRVHRGRAARRLRRGGLDGRAAVVHRRGGVVGRLLRRIHLHPAGRATAAGAEGDRAGVRHRRPLHRRHALPRRGAQRQQPAGLPDVDARDECAAADGRAQRPSSTGPGASGSRRRRPGWSSGSASSTTARTGATARCDRSPAGSCARC